MNNTVERKPLRLKFVDQNSPSYEKEVLKLSDLTENELKEALDIIIRLKKKAFYSKCMIEEMLPYVSETTVKNKAEEFLQIRKLN